MSGQGIFKTGATLALIAAICTSLVAATYQATHEKIAANEKALLEQSLQPALAGLFYDSGVSESRLVIEPPHDLPGKDPAVIYRVFAGEEAVAALFAVTARDGFSGPIRILVGVEYDGTVSGVRILQHRETPGLGDKIESRRSDWILQFDGRSIGDPVVTGWAFQSHGPWSGPWVGIYFEANRDEIFLAEPSEEDK